MNRTTHSLPPIFGRCELAAETANNERRTVELVFYSGAPVFRFPLFAEPFELVFEMTARAANLARLNAGAPIIDSHKAHDGVRGQLGVVEKAWLAGGKAHARVRFSQRDDVTPIWQDVRAGIIRNVSMGTYILEMEEITEDGAATKRFNATSWDPYELSLVPIGADPGAQIVQTLANAPMRPCSVTYHEKELTRMSNDNAQNEANGADLEAARIAEIRRITAHLGVGDVVAQKLIASGSSIEEAITLGSEMRAKRGPAIDGRIDVGADYDGPFARAEQMAEGLSARARCVEPAPIGRRYHDSTFAEIAFECLRAQGLHRGLDVRRHESRIVELALHTTSDYANILGNTVNRILQPEYEAAAPSYRAICARRTFNDFRPHSFVRLGDFPTLLEVHEHGEIRHGSISESKETVSVANYSRIFGITRRVMVNDDLGAFTDLAAKAGRRAAAVEDALFFTMLTANAGMGPTMSDSLTLFHASHSNVGTGTISVTSVGDGVAVMMKQTGLDGIKLNVEPAILLTAPERIAIARQFVSQNLRPTQPSEANPFANLRALADANLTTAAPWYLFADPGANPAFVYGHLAGDTGPRVDTRAGWNIEGVEMRVCLDFGVGSIDYRGAFRSTGA